jgi:hypothetical protein
MWLHRHRQPSMLRRGGIGLVGVWVDYFEGEGTEMEEAASSRRRWGPFSGGQLTVMIVALIAGVVMVPSTVWAVDTFSNVAVEDPVTGVKASVDSTHHLTVAGTVHALAASPTLPFSFSEDITSAALTRVVGPTVNPINLTAISVAPRAGQTGTGDFYLYVGSQPSAQASCTQSISYTLYHVPAVQSSPVFVESFPTPLVIARPAAGNRTCVYAYVGTTAPWTVNGSGFLGS